MLFPWSVHFHMFSIGGSENDEKYSISIQLLTNISLVIVEITSLIHVFSVFFRVTHIVNNIFYVSVKEKVLWHDIRWAGPRCGTSSTNPMIRESFINKIWYVRKPLQWWHHLVVTLPMAGTLLTVAQHRVQLCNWWNSFM